MYKTLFYISLLFFASCINSNKSNYSEEEYYGDTDSEVSYLKTDSVESEEDEFDGTYEAEIDYYNPETGTQSTYTLEVEVEDGELTVIHWPNGGWLDDSHFYPPDITSGYASFESDEGYEYEVRLIEKIE